MLKTRAAFYFKHKYIYTENCVVEKTIRLSGEQFDLFSANLLKDYDFIRDNKSLMKFGENDTFHCLLITGEGRGGGILVHSDGRDYARHVAFVNDVQALEAAQSPALKRLNESLSAFADHLAKVYLAMLKYDDRAALYLSGQASDFDVDISYSGTLREAIIEMVGERLDGHNLDLEYDNCDLIVTRAPAMAGPEQPAAPDMELKM